MLQAIITVGISASGKSTFTKEFIVSEKRKGRQWVEVNRDNVRFGLIDVGGNWNTYEFSRKNENYVTEICNSQIQMAKEIGHNLIISDTNLNKDRQESLAEKLRQMGYDVQFKVFDITLDEAIKRDRVRANSVGEEVIYRQYRQYLELTGRKTYVPDHTLPPAVVFDVDGTLAQMVDRKPFDWHRVGEDEVREEVWACYHGFKSLGYKIIVLSGRDGVCRPETEEWLKENGVKYDELYMREQGDNRKDTVIKEELFWSNVADRYNVRACVDDRPQIVDLWYELKIPTVIAVANHRVKF